MKIEVALFAVVWGGICVAIVVATAITIGRYLTKRDGGLRGGDGFE